jgi:hypothetical protein
MSSVGYTPRCRQGDVKRRTGRQWRSGPPLHIGWWNASSAQDVRAWRWWDGERWSRVVFVDREQRLSAVYAAAVARQPEPKERQRCILWTDYWPEGARVPRIAP